MQLGILAKYFHTPISFFMDLDMVELDHWIQVRNEMERQVEAQHRRLAGKGA